MAYIEKRQESAFGDVVEVLKYYSLRALPEKREQRERRARRKKQTNEQQKMINGRLLERRLMMNMRNNFQEGDYYLTLTFKKIITKEKAERAYATFIKWLQRSYKAAGAGLRYMAAMGGGRVHYHILLNRVQGVAFRRIVEAWERRNGHISADTFGTNCRLYGNGDGLMVDCAKVAAYLRANACQTGGSVRVSLKVVPCRKARRKRVMRADCFSMIIKAPKGYHEVKELTRQEYTRAGYPCQHVIFVRDGT